MSAETVVYEPHPRYAVQRRSIAAGDGGWKIIAQYDGLEEAKKEADRIAKSGDRVRVIDRDGV